ncbi:MAG TPA: hypothetical protein ENG61_00655 [Candidatus Korarchaeota archaeon]|nr:MAG: hypothetical protein DRO05_03410 [Candidatus Korarchaeota archaeon]HDD68854.1 hypothetical protein [Candidatus Korarchaeota archaeon]
MKDIGLKIVGATMILHALIWLFLSVNCLRVLIWLIRGPVETGLHPLLWPFGGPIMSLFGLIGVIGFALLAIICAIFGLIAMFWARSILHSRSRRAFILAVIIYAVLLLICALPLVRNSPPVIFIVEVAVNGLGLIGGMLHIFHETRGS